MSKFGLISAQTAVPALAKLILASACFLLAACLSSGSKPQNEELSKVETVALAAPESSFPKPSIAEAEAEEKEEQLISEIEENLESVSFVIHDPSQVDSLRARGEYLVTGVAGCGVCHGAEPGNPDSALSGSRLLSDSYGEVKAPNITPNRENGIGGWNVWDLMQAIRRSQRKGGEAFPETFHLPYRWMSDQDAKAIAVYLLSQPAVNSVVQRRKVSNFSLNNWGMFPPDRSVHGYVPALAEKSTHQYGEYLVKHVAACGNCHSPEQRMLTKGEPLSGRRQKRKLNFIQAVKALGGLFMVQEKPLEETYVSSMLSTEGATDYQRARGSVAPSRDADEIKEEVPEPDFLPAGADIRGTSESGLLTWDEDDIVGFLSSGQRRDGKKIAGNYCPWPYYERMSLRDKRAIALYLKQL